MSASAMTHYPESLGALRCALGDAAALCDALSDEIIEEGTSRGHIKKRAQEDAALVKRCADLIWAMREKIKRP